MSTPKQHVWGPDEGLTTVLAKLGYKHRHDSDLHVVTRLADGKEVYASTRTNAYELCVLWLLKTRQVKLTSDLERAANGGLSQPIE